MKMCSADPDFVRSLYVDMCTGRRIKGLDYPQRPRDLSRVTAICDDVTPLGSTTCTHLNPRYSLDTLYIRRVRERPHQFN
jgi:hypothetical protein